MAQQNYLQNGTFAVEKQSKKGHIATTYSYRLTQMQSKVYFYEGQVDPLLQDNDSLKDQILYMSRMVSVSTDTLRKLLPTGDPSVKMKIDMANLEGVAEMVRQEINWLHGQIDVRDKNIKQLLEKQAKIITDFEERQKEYKQEIQGWKNKYQKMELQLNQTLALLKEEISESTLQKDKIIQELKHQITQKQGVIDKIDQQKTQIWQELTEKIGKYAKEIIDLNKVISNFQKQKQQAKQVVKKLCEQLMQKKLKEQSQVFEHALKSKESQKMAVQIIKDDTQRRFQAELNRKNESISNLTSNMNKYKNQLFKVNDRLDMYHNDVILEQNKNKNLQDQINREKQIVEKLKQDLSLVRQQVQAEKQKLKEAFIDFDKEKKFILKQNQQALAKVNLEKQALQKTIQENQSTIEQLKNEAGQTVESWKKKIQQTNIQWQEKAFELREEVLRKQKIIEEDRSATKTIKQKYQDEIYQLERGHIFQRQNIQKNFQQAKDDLIRQYQISLRKLKQDKQIQLLYHEKMKNKQIQDLIQKHDTKIKIMQQQFLDDMKKQTQKNIEERAELEQKYKQTCEQKKNLKFKLQKVQRKVAQQQTQFESSRVDYIKRMRKTSEEKEQETKKLHEIIEQQVNKFQGQLQQQSDYWIVRQKQFSTEIQQLKEMKGINEIQRRHERQINRLKKQHKNQIKELQSTFDKSIQSQIQMNEQKIKEAQQQNQRLCDVVRQQCGNLLNALEKQSQQMLISIAEKSQEKNKAELSRKNAGIEDADLSQLQTQPLLEYIFKILQQLHYKINDQSQAIQQLTYQLSNKTNQIQQFQQNNDGVLENKLRTKRQEMEFLKKQLMAKMEMISNQCKAKLQASYQQRLEFTHKMMREFQEMKKDHQQKYSVLENKYYELEQLFNDRPSRGQDVAAIKNLQSLTQKMDFQVKNFKKKAQTANQIVKYLNLQLENYKDTYHIFGANMTKSTQPQFPSIKSKTGNVQHGPPQKVKKLKSETTQKDERSKQSKTQQKIVKFKDDYKTIVRQANHKHRHQQAQKQTTPKQTNIFGAQIRNFESFGEEDDISSTDLRQNKHSLPLKKQKERYKTEKITPLKKDEQIITHAEMFMKLIGPSDKDKDQSIEKQKQRGTYLSKKRSIRRRVVSKRNNTEQAEHFF